MHCKEAIYKMKVWNEIYITEKTAIVFWLEIDISEEANVGRGTSEGESQESTTPVTSIALSFCALCICIPLELALLETGENICICNIFPFLECYF